ncbi:hypothetical protein CYMTET_46746 [Cymbomonas tetramitiformis]|uniref:Reverse transcriptase RNase H-like domain-containing protein n=1 Tax=Cymbomonas tetramitiformis TaxID=36881 RepID=A0AAE0EX93_9CHLO|nr:hypothetical protein CYMTET_46749 [Cymbomonas tetramitiformis]KAK3243615.1 hypothetical protein CYMTET_46746 [Cymbomonas tetramitiformis]
MATRGDSEEGAYAAVAGELPYPAVDHDDNGKPTTETVKTENPDSRDAKVSPEWRKRFEAFFTEYEEQLRAALPELSKLRNSKEDNAHVILKQDKEGGPPCRRPYKMSVEELRQLRERIEQLMEKGEKGVYLKASKAKLCKESLRFLGHTLSAKGCQPQHDKIASVESWPVLETVTHVRQFLGLAGYYRRFVHHFSEIAQPLTVLTKSDVPWDLGNGMQPIAYESRQFSAAEQNYHTGERELCGLHHCTTVTWRHYLIFSEFKLQGDHRPLEWLMSPGRELSRRQACWYMDLVEVGVPRMEY